MSSFFFSGASAPPRPVPCRAGKKKNSTTPKKKIETLNGRLPPEDGSDRAQTWGKRVSDDSRHLIFRRPKFLFDEIFGPKMKNQIKNRSIRRSYKLLSVIGKFSTKNHPISPEFQIITFLGEGIQKRVSIFSLTFGPKPTYTFSSRMMI